MKKLMIIMSLGLFYPAHAKNVKQLDTIYANSTMTIALFFPSDIKQGITGSENFVFTYNREKGENLGLLKAVKGDDSNLLVLTTDGKVYSYILKYTENLESLNRFITVEESIGDARGTPIEVLTAHMNPKKPTYTPESLIELQQSCESLLELPERRNIWKIEDQIALSLRNLEYQGDHVFLQFELANKSEIRFDFGHLTIAKINGNQKRNASYQEILLEPVYIHKKPTQILPGTTVKMVWVVPKFTVAKNERMKVWLQELNTTRKVSLVWK